MNDLYCKTCNERKSNHPDLPLVFNTECKICMARKWMEDIRPFDPANFVHYKLVTHDLKEIESFNVRREHEEEKGTKFDNEKPIYSCLPPAGMRELGKTQALGAKKYGPNNYRKGIEVSRLLDAAFRHLLAASSGVDYDEEGNNHLSACAWNCLVAIQMIADHHEMDNRYKEKSNA